jgi:hypothetical protein
VVQTLLPAIPSGLTIAPSGPDPELSVPAVAVRPGMTITVPVNIDTARPDGSTGATEAILALQYDPQLFDVSATDIQLGSLTSSGWQMTAVVNRQTGEIGIDLFSSTPILTAAAGSLVTISMHVDAGAGSLASLTPLTVVSQVNPTGTRAYRLEVADAQGALVLHVSGGQQLVENRQASVADASLQKESPSWNTPLDIGSTAVAHEMTGNRLPVPWALPGAQYLEPIFAELSGQDSMPDNAAWVPPGPILNADFEELPQASVAHLICPPSGNAAAIHSWVEEDDPDGLVLGLDSGRS